MTEQPYFMRLNPGGFGNYRPEDEYLHPEFEAGGNEALTETQLFGFSVPEQRVHSILYAWHHPGLNLVSSGVHVFQGVKSHSPGAEICDYRHFQGDSAFRRGFPNHELASGYRVEMLESGRSFRTSYSDPKRRNSFDVTHSAVSEPIVWPGSRHFEQIMRTRGEVVLLGQRLRVDGYHVRDRSWGQPRPEDPFGNPPHSWVMGVFDDGLAFHVTATDDPARRPLWAGRYPHFDPEQSLKFGWLLIDGRKTMIRSASKLTTYDRDRLLPASLDILLIDEHDRSHHFRGTVVAALPTHLWHNTRIPVCLARWEYGDRVGWGDVQECQYPDFVLANC